MYSVVTIKNVGETPAYRLFTFGSASIRTIEKLGTKKLSICDSEESAEKDASPPSALGAGSTRRIRVDRTDQDGKDIDQVSNKDIVNFQNGKSYYIIKGVVCYRDVFNDWHRTFYCKYFDSEKSLRDNTIEVCPSNNRSDNDMD
jgi:hypothetical protein